MEIQGWMSSAVGHDGPLSLCNNWAVTSAATSRWDDAFPTNNHPCKIIFRKTAGQLLPSLLSEAFWEKQLARNHSCCLQNVVRGATIRSWMHGASNAPRSLHRNSEHKNFTPINVLETLL